MFKKKNLIHNVIKQSLLAACVGLICGLVFGLVIWGILYLLAGMTTETPPMQIAAFLGMGAGTAIGAVLGGVAGLKGK